MMYVAEVGNAGGPAEVRSVASGDQVANFSVALPATLRQGGDANSPEDWRSEWVRISVWGQRNVERAQQIQKGDIVEFRGELTWETFTGSNGGLRVSFNVRADRFRVVMARARIMPSSNGHGSGGELQTVGSARAKAALDDEAPF